MVVSDGRNRQTLAPARPHLIFIGGGQRSGTTLTQTIIANLLSSRVLPEAHVLFDVIASYKRAKRDLLKNLELFEGPSGIQNYFSDSVDLLLRNVKKQIADDRCIVFKDPNFSTIFDQIQDVVRVPFSRILVVRDPRDIAASFINIGFRDKKEGTNSKYAKRNISYICEKINESYDLHLGKSESHFEFTVYYEELVTSPMKALKGVVSRFGVDEQAIAAGLGSIEWLPSSKLHKPSWVSNLEGGPISTDSVGAYKTILKREEVELVQKNCSPLFTRFGYQAN